MGSFSLLQVIEAAHSVGLKTTSTLMFGHVEDGPLTWSGHLLALRWETVRGRLPGSCLVVLPGVGSPLEGECSLKPAPFQGAGRANGGYH